MKKKHVFFLIGVVAIIAVLALGSTKNSSVSEKSDSRSAVQGQQFTIEAPKASGCWALVAVVSIDGDAGGVGAHNWTWAVAQSWCSGAGSAEDPYLIENVSISVDDGSNPALKIVDTNVSKHIELNNVTVVNANVNGNGVWIEDCENVDVINCDFSGNGVNGLYMLNVNSSTITGTNCIDNYVGIYMDYCVLNTLTTLNCSENALDGIDMLNCTYNTVSSSYFQTNAADGLYIVDSDLNNITVESDDNNRGLVLIDSDECIITGCEFWDNTAYGIVLTEDDGDTLDNLIYDNIFSGNDVNAVDNSSVANDWDNGALGNDWDNYPYYDGNDDGIGDLPMDVEGSAGAEDRFPIFDDGAEPVVTLDEEDDLEDLFEDEKTAPKTLETSTIVLIVFVGALCFAIVMLLYLGAVKAPIKKSIKRSKNAGKKFKNKVKGKLK